MAASTLDFSPRQVADALGVSESSVKRWCDREVVPSIRTAGGHRRITLEGLMQFLAQSGRALSNPEAVGLRETPLFRKRIALPEPSQTQGEFLESLMAGDEESCLKMIQHSLDQGATAWETAEKLITDSMHRFGEAWECGAAEIYQERRACDICIRLINQLRYATHAPGADAPVAIGCTLSGDPYQLPTAMVELALRETGWAATSLGSNLPVETLVQAAKDYRPRLVWVSVSEILDRERFVQDFNRLYEELGSEVALVVGGRLIDDSLRPRLQCTAHCNSLSQLTELVGFLRMRNFDWRASEN